MLVLGSGEDCPPLPPTQVGYQLPGQEPQMPTFGTKRQLEVHRSEPLLFEVEVLKVRPGGSS
jgi:hypothetical protein